MRQTAHHQSLDTLRRLKVKNIVLDETYFTQFINVCFWHVKRSTLTASSWLFHWNISSFENLICFLRGSQVNSFLRFTCCACTAPVPCRQIELCSWSELDVDGNTSSDVSGRSQVGECWNDRVESSVRKVERDSLSKSLREKDSLYNHSETDCDTHTSQNTFSSSFCLFEDVWVATDCGGALNLVLYKLLQLLPSTKGLIHLGHIVMEKKRPWLCIKIIHINKYIPTHN